LPVVGPVSLKPNISNGTRPSGRFRHPKLQLYSNVGATSGIGKHYQPLANAGSRSHETPVDSMTACDFATRLQDWLAGQDRHFQSISLEENQREIRGQPMAGPLKLLRASKSQPRSVRRSSDRPRSAKSLTNLAPKLLVFGLLNSRLYLGTSATTIWIPPLLVGVAQRITLSCA